MQRSKMEASRKATTQEYYESMSAANIALELLDDEPLFSDDGFY
jgi:hypothetical protein